MINTKPTLKSTFKALLYLAPLLIITIGFTIWPLIDTFLMSCYTKYNYYTNQVSTLGSANFSYLWHDPDFHLAVRNTLILVVGVVPASIILALGVALLLNRITRLAKLFRTLYFLPFVTSTVAVALVWHWIFRMPNGLLNGGLHWFGIAPVNWLNDPHYALFALIIVCIWHDLGLNVLLFLAGLNHVNPHYYLAASLDGATAWQQFRLITWPLLTPMTVLVTVNAMITNFKVFNQVYVLFNGTAGPANADLTMLYYLYQKFYIEDQVNVAAASGVVLLLLIGSLTGLTFYYFRRNNRQLRGDR